MRLTPEQAAGPLRDDLLAMSKRLRRFARMGAGYGRGHQSPHVTKVREIAADLGCLSRIIRAQIRLAEQQDGHKRLSMH